MFSRLEATDGKALPTKPLNTVALADADAENSLGFVQDKLASFQDVSSLSVEEKELVGKLGGRMVYVYETMERRMLTCYQGPGDSERKLVKEYPI